MPRRVRRRPARPARKPAAAVRYRSRTSRSGPASAGRWTRCRRRPRSRPAPVPRTAHTARPTSGPARNRFCGSCSILTLRDAGERPLDQMLQRREDQPEADQGQRHQGGPPDRVLRQVQRRQQGGTGQGDHAEATDQAARSPDTAGPRGCCRSRVPSTPERNTTGSTGRMHGEMPVIRPPRNPISATVRMAAIRMTSRRDGLVAVGEGMVRRRFNRRGAASWRAGNALGSATRTSAPAARRWTAS